MSSVDVNQQVKVFKEHRKRVTDTREKAVEFLVRAGIVTKKSAMLTPPYR